MDTYGLFRPGQVQGAHSTFFLFPSDEVLPLNQNTGVYGSQESAAGIYFAACHSYLAGYVNGVREFRYDVKGQD